MFESASGHAAVAMLLHLAPQPSQDGGPVL
jgi:hypothetical protein